MNIIESLLKAPQGILDNFLTLLDMIKNALTGLSMFYNLLKEFDDKVVAMVDNCGASEFDGLPVVKAIATFHYVVGDIIFYLIYLVILFGCLWTIYKLVVLMYNLAKMLFNQLSNGVSSKGQLTSLLSKVFK